MKVPACYTLCLMYNAANQLLGIWCIDLSIMCRLDSSVNYILNDILTSSLRFTSRIRKHWNKLLYIYTLD